MNKVADPARYPVELFYSEEDEGYIAIARDLPGCSAFGKSQGEAIAEIQHAIEAWQQAADAAHNPIPEPSRHEEEPLPSGRLLLRIPRSLHAALIECAKRETVSLNQHLVSVLSFSVSASILRQSYMLSSLALLPFQHSAMARTLPGLGSVFGGGRTIVDVVSAGGGVGTTVDTVFAGTFKKIHFAEPAATFRTTTPFDLQSLPQGIPVIRSEDR